MMDKNQAHYTDMQALEFQESWPEFFLKTGLCRETFTRFRSIIFQYYLSHCREFSWREQITPYRVVVSELMLQQTQTIRVAQKFDIFVETFPDFQSLAEASFGDVLKVWKGLGYNRRARFLRECAILVVENHGGVLPEDPKALVTFPGIGPATASSICAFAFNAPVAFVETNIRTVFIHFFFAGVPSVHDREILPLVEQALYHRRPREWYYALMDYGVMLKKAIGNLGRRSSHYSRQSRFEGSDRQIRGRILQLLLDRQTVAHGDLPELLDEMPDRVSRIVTTLCDENLLIQTDTSVMLG